MSPGAWGLTWRIIWRSRGAEGWIDVLGLAQEKDREGRAKGFGKGKGGRDPKGEPD